MQDRRQLITSQHFFELQEILRRSRPWFHREYYKHRVHPAIWDALELARPKDWHQLVLEHPYQSELDPARLAYTQDDRAGDANRQTVTTIGKYLRRHFPDLSDHEIRDIQALHIVNGVKIVRTTVEMIYHLQRGPKSCMVSTSFEHHPYECYDPDLGWAMAVREEGDDTVGRALINDSDPDNRIYVRSYRKNGDGYSQTDDQIEAWLKSKGYTKASDWEGRKLKVIPHRGSYVAPYLDGNCKQASLHKEFGGASFFLIDEDGEYDMSSTCGFAAETNRSTCEDCGDSFNDDDGFWVGISENTRVCDACCSNNYIYAYSRRGNQYHIPNDETIDVDGDYYHTDYLSDNEIVCDIDGEYHRADDCVFVEREMEYYTSDDDRIRYAEDTEQYELKENCWLCTESSNWYTDDCEDWVEIDGDRYHKDNAPEQTKEKTNE
jgi:hypothetical protein